MKKDTEKILYSLDAEDLGPLLDKKYGEDLDKQDKTALYDKVKRITGAETKTVRKPRLIAAVVAAVLVISLSLGVYAYALDVKEYNEAVAYLTSIDYPTEGMSRGEIKRFYRSIVASPFGEQEEDGKEVRVEITGFDMDLISDPAENGGITYEINIGHKSEVNYYYLQKNDGNTVLWTYSKENGSVKGYYPVSGGRVAVCGAVFMDGKENLSLQYYALLDENGKPVWETIRENDSVSGFDYVSGYAEGIFEKEDGTFLALGFVMTMIGDDVETYLSLTEISENGDILNKKNIPTTCYFGGKHFVGLRYCTRFGDGFIAFLAAHGSDRFEGLVKISSDGEIGQVFAYGEEGVEYIVNGIKEYGGRLFISADAITPDRGTNNDYSSERTNLLSAPLNRLINSDGADLLPHDCTGIIKNSCSAVLIVCDSESDTPNTFYKENGAVSGALGIDEAGRLTWKTMSVTSGKAYNRFLSHDDPTDVLEVICSYTVHQYTFEKDGRSAVKVKTGTRTGVKF